MRTLAALALIASLALAVWVAWPLDETKTVASAVTLQPAALSQIAPATRSTGEPVSGLSHSEAPELGSLRDAPSRQAAYDAEARSGEFVTPPQVSVEH